MSEHIRSTSELFQPGNVIEIPDLNELILFEDLIAEDVDPDYDEYLWEARPDLEEYRLLVPTNFYGKLRSIELLVMENPYDRLLDANQRGWTFKKSSSKNLELTNELNQKLLVPRYRGFALTAETHSSGRGVVGQIQAEMWYYPVPFLAIKAGKVHRDHFVRKDGSISEHTYRSRKDSVTRNNASPYALRRVITKPKFEKNDFIKLEATNRRIGMIALGDLRDR